MELDQDALSCKEYVRYDGWNHFRSQSKKHEEPHFTVDIPLEITDKGM